MSAKDGRAGRSQLYLTMFFSTDVKRLTRALLAVGYGLPRLIRTMETSMHGSLGRSGQADGNVGRGWRIAFFALPVLILVALVRLASTGPGVSTWISEAVQAEFTAANDAADPAPTRLARPAGETRAAEVK